MGATALITGVTGQDGSYLAEFLLGKGCRVVGLVRRSSAPNHWRIRHLLPEIELRRADLLDTFSLVDLISEVEPDEIYNLAAQSFVPASWEQPLLTAEVTALGVTRMLEAARLVNPAIKFYQASSSEMFGNTRESPQNENTPFHPRSPYGVAKAYGHFVTVNQREGHGVFACSGILFNHESPRRGEEFVTRKITRAAARISGSSPLRGIRLPVKPTISVSGETSSSARSWPAGMRPRSYSSRSTPLWITTTLSAA